MKTLEDQLSQYAAYHRDARNIATHFVGIPMIVLAVTTLLARPTAELGGLVVSPAAAVALLTAVYYVALDVAIGLLMAVLLALAVWFGQWAGAQPTETWLAIGVGGFVVGWVIQFVGHVWEGRKPAFVDDVVGLIVGPLFVVVEALFGFGLLRDLQDRVEARAGKVKAAFAVR